MGGDRDGRWDGEGIEDHDIDKGLEEHFVDLPAHVGMMALHPHEPGLPQGQCESGYQQPRPKAGRLKIARPKFKTF